MTLQISRASALRPALAALGFIVLTSAAQAAETVTVTDAWARASAGQARTGAAFATLNNSGSEDDTLVAAAMPDACETAELHTHVKEGEVMRMRKVEDIALPAGKSVTLAPGGLHIMCMGLKTPLKEGDSHDLTLTFSKAGPVTVPVQVRSAGAAGMSDGAMGHGGMEHHKMNGAK